jgi:hypothetical protein
MQGIRDDGRVERRTARASMTQTKTPWLTRAFSTFDVRFVTAAKKQNGPEPVDAQASVTASAEQDAYYPLKASADAAKSAPDAPTGMIRRILQVSLSKTFDGQEQIQSFVVA